MAGDVVCINQTDLDERSQQVNLMGDVYRSASHVLAWLGESDEDASMAIDFLTYLEKTLSSYESS